jgi:hypothetical protein
MLYESSIKQQNTLLLFLMMEKTELTSRNNGLFITAPPSHISLEKREIQGRFMEATIRFYHGSSLSSQA